VTTEALLLLGPTGVGKSPLGDLLEREGLWGRACRHFDFGARLRAIAAGTLRPAGLTDEQVAEVETALDTGALLTDAQWPIAGAILADFLAIAPADLVVLNGLPRHETQAIHLAAFLDVGWVAHLEAGPEVLRARIRHDAGGDRDGRVDDDPAAVEARLDRFRRRTLPLVAHYRSAGAGILEVPVGARTEAEAVRATLEGA
jgi:adenylate kinase family enzyme